MPGFRQHVLKSALAVALACGSAVPVARAAEETPTVPQDETKSAVDALLSTLRGIIQAIPQYHLPEINEDGDIIIRRVRPKPNDSSHDVPPEAVET